jgi:hypothetical protein
MLLSNLVAAIFTLCQSQGQLLRHELELWWGLERSVNPCPEIAVDKQLLAEQCHQVRQRPGEGRAQLQILEA